ncbi:MAG: hypothetical protein K0V04_05110 [Deltaproteobacteria bacterium]|nr:hypothetical protein [Deltaproteobacteria bacterium]
MVTQQGRMWASVFGATVFFAASTAAASNGTKPRIPVDWSDSACMNIVDRSTGTMRNIPYSIAQEDTDITDDEVADSRTHQFFAMCRARDPQTFLPRWITQADIDAANAVGAAPDDIDPEDVFETSTTWADCWHRITPDDERRPITFAAAGEGQDWDTSAVPAGTYTIEAYTWEPPLNIYSLHPGVYKIVDSPGLADSPPALGVSNTEEVINRNETATIHGCVSAMEGSTITAYWGRAASEVEWQPFIENDPVTGETFAVEFTPPESVVGESTMIRVDVTDPMGRSYTNYMRELVIVLGTDGPSDCEDGGGFIGGAGCEDDTGTGGEGSGTGEGSDTGATSNATTPGLDDGEDGGGNGCGCRSQGSTPAGIGLFGLLLLWRRRR